MFVHAAHAKGRSERLEPCALKGHARFLGEGVLATVPPYPTLRQIRELEMTSNQGEHLSGLISAAKRDH